MFSCKLLITSWAQAAGMAIATVPFLCARDNQLPAGYLKKRFLSIYGISWVSGSSRVEVESDLMGH